MPYPKEIINQAFEILNKRRNRSIAQNNMRQRELEATLPQVAELEANLRYTSAGLAKAILSGVNVEEKIERLKNDNLYMQERRRDLILAGGFGAEYLDDQFICNDCQDRGFANEIMCHCARDLMKELMLKKLDETVNTQKYSFENFSLEYYSPTSMTGRDVSARLIMTRTLSMCREYAEKFSSSSRNLLFQGATGLGKTHLSIAIAAKVIEKGFDVIYSPAQSLISKLENERFHKGGEDGLSEFVIGCDLLILDDLGSENINNFSSATIHDIVNSRLIEGRPTIINTNLSAQAIEKIYSDRIVSRLLGEYMGIPFVGSDIRIMKK